MFLLFLNTMVLLATLSSAESDKGNRDDSRDSAWDNSGADSRRPGAGGHSKGCLADQSSSLRDLPACDFHR